MKILTIGRSPQLSTDCSSIHSDIVTNLKDMGHDVVVGAIDHVTSYFLPNSKGEYWMDDIRIYPLSSEKIQSKSFKEFLELVKKTNPDIVVSIGDYYDLSFIGIVKESLPFKFKWFSVLMVDNCPVNERYLSYMRNADCTVTTNEKAKQELLDRHGFSILYENPGIRQLDRELSPVSKDEFLISASSLNVSNANFNIIYESVVSLKSKNKDKNIKCFIHTNIDDSGFYDLFLLTDRYKSADFIKFPEDYSSVTEDLGEKYYEDVLKRSSVFLDVYSGNNSYSSVLKAMSFGCAIVSPICIGDCSGVLRNKEIRHNERSEDLHLPYVGNVIGKLTLMLNMWLHDLDQLNHIRKKSFEAAKAFDRRNFIISITTLITKIGQEARPTMPIEEFCEKKSIVKEG